MLSTKKLLYKILSVPTIHTEYPTGSATISGNTNGVVGVSLPTVSGYAPVAIGEITNSHGANLAITDFTLVNSTYARVVLRNLSSASATVTIKIRVLYARVGGVIRKVLSSICDALSAKGVVVC